MLSIEKRLEENKPECLSDDLEMVGLLLLQFLYPFPLFKKMFCKE